MDVEERLGRLERRLGSMKRELQWLAISAAIAFGTIGWFVIDGHYDEMELLTALCVQVECPREVFDQ